jgi:hypothetical protein
MNILNVNEKKKVIEERSSIFIFLTIISFPFSDNVIFFLKLQDFFILGFVFLNYKILDKNEVSLIFYIILILVFTNLIGILIFEEFHYKKLALFYKLILPIIFFFQVSKFFNYANSKFFEKYLDIIFLIYLGYIFFAYKWDVDFMFYKSHYPGSIRFFDPTFTGDRHLMATIVGFFLTMKLFFLAHEKKYLTLIFLWFIFINFLFLFESRVSSIFLILIMYIHLNQFFKIIKHKYLFQYFLYFFIFLIFLYYFNNVSELKKIFNLYEFGAFSDIIRYQTVDVGPHANRIISFFLIAPDNIIFYFTGTGFLHYNYAFLDSGIILLITSFGLLPLLFLIILIKNKFNCNLLNNTNLNIIFFTTLLINFFVAEFFMVSRYIFITIIIYQLVSIKSEFFFSKDIKDK